MKKPFIGTFNEAWVRSVTKEQFMDSQAHLSDQVDLSLEYDKITGNGISIRATEKNTENRRNKGGNRGNKKSEIEPGGTTEDSAIQGGDEQGDSDNTGI